MTDPSVNLHLTRSFEVRLGNDEPPELWYRVSNFGPECQFHETQQHRDGYAADPDRTGLRLLGWAWQDAYWGGCKWNRGIGEV